MEFNFSNKHYEFFVKEFEINKTALNKMTKDKLEDLYEDVVQIEIVETIEADDNALSQRGETAVEIVNIMAEAFGYVQDDYDEEIQTLQTPQPIPQRTAV